jgi:hypothetical protein
MWCENIDWTGFDWLKIMVQSQATVNASEPFHSIYSGAVCWLAEQLSVFQESPGSFEIGTLYL